MELVVKWKDLVNEAFLPLVDCKDRFLILYGGRGSSKSDFVAKKLIFDCLAQPYFKCIMYRKSYNTIKDSSFETVKQIIESKGLDKYFEFRFSPLAIICKLNGNKFIARGGDKPKSLKSIKDPTVIWYEEEIPNENDFAVMSMTLRSGKASYLQEIFSINPDLEEDYEQNWFWKLFFQGQSELSFKRTNKIEIEGKEIEVNTTVHHSTYKDNRFLTPEYKALIESYRTKSEYLYSLYAKGLWTKKQRGGNFYKHFSRAKHVQNVAYNPQKPLHISFDFNVKPYITLVIWQNIEAKTVAQIDEICLMHPQNTTKALCYEFLRRYQSHSAGVFVYGDSSGKAESTRENGVIRQGINEYTMIAGELAPLKPDLRIMVKNPNIIRRGQFINSVFENEFAGVKIVIDPKCKNSITDFEYLLEDAEGKKTKQKGKDKDGSTYEMYGHTSDASDYFLCQYFEQEFYEFQFGKFTAGGNVAGAIKRSGSF